MLALAQTFNVVNMRTYKTFLHLAAIFTINKQTTAPHNTLEQQLQRFVCHLFGDGYLALISSLTYKRVLTGKT